MEANVDQPLIMEDHWIFWWEVRPLCQVYRPTPSIPIWDLPLSSGLITSVRNVGVGVSINDITEPQFPAISTGRLMIERHPKTKTLSSGQVILMAKDDQFHMYANQMQSQ